jgi:hypothetical protein
MNLVGQFVAIMLSHQAYGAFAGMSASEIAEGIQGRGWLFGGWVRGEQPGVGLWLEAQEIRPPDVTPPIAGHDYRSTNRPTYLIRWDLISSIRLSSEPPAELPAPGQYL